MGASDTLQRPHELAAALQEGPDGGSGCLDGGGWGGGGLIGLIGDYLRRTPGDQRVGSTCAINMLLVDVCFYK